jgi:hypothetical protein
VAQARQGYSPEEEGYYAMDIGFASMCLETALFGLKADALQQIIAKSARVANSLLLEKAIVISQCVEADDLLVHRRVAYALCSLDVPLPTEPAARRIQVYDARADTLASLARALGSVGEVGQAEKAADSIPDPTRRRDASSQIALALADAGFVEAAIQVIKRNDDLYEPSEAWSRAKAIGAVATHATRMRRTGDLRYLADLASGITDEGARLQSLVAVGLEMVKCGDRDGVNQLATEVRRLVDPREKAKGLAAMANLAARVGVHETPIRMLTDAQAIENEWARAEAIAGISQALSMLNERDRLTAALETLEGIRGDGARADALKGIVQAFVRAGDVEGIYRTVTFLDGLDEFQRAKLLGGREIMVCDGLIYTLYDWGRRLLGIPRAFALLGCTDGVYHCLKLASNLRQDSLRSDSIVGVLLGLAKCSPDKALSQFRTLANDMRDPRRTGELLVEIAQSYVESGDVNALEKVLFEGRLLKDPYARATVISEVARLFAAVDQVDGLRRTCEALEKSFTYEAAKAEAVIGVARAAAQVKDHAVLQRTLDCADSQLYEPSRAKALGGVACAAMRAGATEIVTDALSQSLALLRESTGSSGLDRSDTVDAIADMLRQLSDATDPAILSQVVGTIRELGPEFHRVRGYLEQGRSGILTATANALAAAQDQGALSEVRAITESRPECDEYAYASLGVATALTKLNMSDDAMATLAGVFLRTGGENRRCVLEALKTNRNVAGGSR